MTELGIVLVLALVAGLLASLLRLPPLVGFLVAGFALHTLEVPEPEGLHTIADLGVTLLLFGIGLKLDLRSLLRREVWVTATVHLAVTTLVAAGAVALLALTGVAMAADDDSTTWWVVGFALAFSSTVFAVKLLEQHHATESLAGRTAIGVLIFQDLAAVAFLVVAHGEPPSPWAIALVLLVPAAPLLRRVPDLLGHGELRALFGLTAALVPGFLLFEAVGLEGDLGALVAGMLLASHPATTELARTLLTLKDLLLVGFFVSIGLAGIPTGEHLLVAAFLLLLLPVKGLGFALLFWRHGLRRRTSVRAATSLGNFSEFGLIVGVAATGVVDDDWLVVLATAIAASFVLGSVVGRFEDPMVAAAQRLLPSRPDARLHPEDRPIDASHVNAVVLGMGRVGRAAYERLQEEYGLTVLGVEAIRTRVQALRGRGFEVLEGDATDPEFWGRVRTGDVRIVVLAMPFHGSNLVALEQLRRSGYAGTVGVVTQYDEEAAQAREHGAHTCLQIYDGAGAELADRAAVVAGLGTGDG